MYCRQTILLSAAMETSLYKPVKAFLEKAGYLVKGEIGGCDLMGIRDDDPSVIVFCELKLAFNLELILQAAGDRNARHLGGRPCRCHRQFDIPDAADKSQATLAACARAPETPG